MSNNSIIRIVTRTLLFVLLISIFFSCKKEYKNKSNLFKNSLIDTISQKSTDTLFVDLEVFKDFINNYSDEYFINKSHSNIAHTLLNKTNYLKEYNCQLKRRKTCKNKYNQEVFQIIDCYIFEYESKTICKAAIDSLFNCFPFDCQKLPKKKFIKAVKSPPSIFIFNDRHIIIATIPCEQNGGEWNNFKLELINNFSTFNSEIVSIECGGPLEWHLGNDISAF